MDGYTDNVKCHVMFPGGFKPVTAAHLWLMRSFLASAGDGGMLHVIIAARDRDGITAESSRKFLEEAFAGDGRVTVEVSPEVTPIRTAIGKVMSKAYGDGRYALASSRKGNDYGRVGAFLGFFVKHEPPRGTEVVEIEPPDTGTMKFGDGAEMSATRLRGYVRDGDAESFADSYAPAYADGTIDRAAVDKYFATLRAEMGGGGSLLEGGAAGHMSHPYDIVDFTFEDLAELADSLLAGKVRFKEKLDGQNLFASVDGDGRTIFARNERNLRNEPMGLEDISSNPKWEGIPEVQDAFRAAAETVDSVFRNIPHAALLFNYDDRMDGLRYRNWVNLEVIDTRNPNVIPYAESTVSFHRFVTTVWDYSDKTKVPSFSTIDVAEGTNEKMMEVLSKAIRKTDRQKFGAQITPDVIEKAIGDSIDLSRKFRAELEPIAAEAGGMGTSILDFRRKAAEEYIAAHPAKFSFIPQVALGPLAERWAGGKVSLTEIKKAYGIPVGKSGGISKLDKEMSEVLKRAMRPLDTWCMRLGNQIIKYADGLVNDKHSDEVKRGIRKEIGIIRKQIENSSDEGAKERLKDSLARLASVGDEINPTEGLVFTYKGRTMKLTGSFAPVNQILGQIKYKRK